MKKRIPSDPDLTSGTIVDKVLLFAIPLMLTSMLQQLFNATDIAVVGKFASMEAMAAVGSNTPVVSLLVNFFVGISVGTNVLIAHNIGAREPEKAKSAVRTSMAFALAAGVFVGVLGNIIAVPIIDLLGVPAEVKDYSVTYLRLYFSGVPFIMLYNFEAAIFRSNGNTRTPLICLTIGGIFNVAANLFFVLVLGMDVDGVAIATVLANAISSMLLLHFLRNEDSVIHVNVSKCLYGGIFRGFQYRDIRILCGQRVHTDTGDFCGAELRCGKVREMPRGGAQDPARQLDLYHGALSPAAHFRETSVGTVHERTGGNRSGNAEGKTPPLC